MATPSLNARLEYSLLCDDVRVELGNKLSLMGLFRNIYFYALPSTMLKFAVINHWTGSGQYTSEVKILSPDRSKIVAQAQAAPFVIEPQGFADNITIFANVTFDREGPHHLQVYVNGVMIREIDLLISLIPTSAGGPTTVQ
ncbi:MAG: hypothetical protein PHX83_01650 [Acidobacteriia bacterium]|nr:hypothetical protein [Terriglobia bacterium]